MKAILLIIIVFLVVVYVFTYIRYKKRKKNTVNAVDEFNRIYLKKNKPQKQYVPFETKYNSTVDYIEKEKFIEEINKLT